MTDKGLLERKNEQNLYDKDEKENNISNFEITINFNKLNDSKDKDYNEEENKEEEKDDGSQKGENLVGEDNEEREDIPQENLIIGDFDVNENQEENNHSNNAIKNNFATDSDKNKKKKKKKKKKAEKKANPPKRSIKDKDSSSSNATSGGNIREVHYDDGQASSYRTISEKQKEQNGY